VAVCLGLHGRNTTQCRCSDPGGAVSCGLAGGLMRRSGVTGGT
jgi:hypothetical protein